MIKTYHEAPFVPKTPLSLIVLEWSGLESTALRGMLEYFNYRVDTHWIGSRKEFIEILKGNIPTADFLILSCHGDEKEGMYTCPDEKPLLPDEIRKASKLKNKTILSLGCATGTDEFAAAFLDTGSSAYIAPKDYPFGNSSLLFAIHLCYQVSQHKKPLAEAFEMAKKYEKESSMFQLWQK